MFTYLIRHSISLSVHKNGYKLRDSETYYLIYFVTFLCFQKQRNASASFQVLFDGRMMLGLEHCGHKFDWMS